MMSELAMQDIEALESAGLLLTPREIVRLNAVALRSSAAPDAADIIAAPRIGWAGPVALHQPTIGSDLWLDSYASRWFSGDDLLSATAFASAHADVPGFFSRLELRREESARAELTAWQESLPVTGDQLRVALDYAIFGKDPAAGELAASKEPTPEVADRLHDLMAEFAAAGISATPEFVAALTSSSLCAILLKWQRNSGVAPSKSTVRAQAEYMLTLAEIRAAAEKRRLQREPATYG